MDSSIKAVLSPPAQEGRSVFSLDAAKNLISIAKESNWRQERRAERGLWRRLWQSEERISAESHFGSEEESPIDRQSIQHQSQPPWSIICNQQKPLSALQAFARENPTAIRTATGFARDAAGATVLHIAVLNARLEMINYLIDKYGAELVQLV
jgi:ankyrin repeat protein